jgi:cytidylate kinase
VTKKRKITIAIDGPAASGKSTTARKVANVLGYTYIDSGAMYRAVTLKALQEKVPVNNRSAVAKVAEKISLKFQKNKKKTIIYMEGKDVSDDIRSPLVDENISPVAANPLVRKILVGKQREMAKGGGVVMDGRDIGTVVFPEAELKIYMCARVEERADRRSKELEQKGVKMNIDQVVADIEYRDKQDVSRRHGPLKKAPDAIELDTTRLTIEQQVEQIIQFAHKVIGNQQITQISGSE